MLLEVLLGSVGHLESGNLVATVLEALDDLADQAALNAVRLDHDVSCKSSKCQKRVQNQKR